MHVFSRIARGQGVTEWVVLIGYSGFVHVATTDAVRKLLTVYQQIPTTMAAGNQAQEQRSLLCAFISQMTKPLVSQFLPVNVVSFLPLTYHRSEEKNLILTVWRLYGTVLS